jgi:hypothetical protein
VPQWNVRFLTGVGSKKERLSEMLYDGLELNACLRLLGTEIQRVGTLIIWFSSNLESGTQGGLPFTNMKAVITHNRLMRVKRWTVVLRPTCHGQTNGPGKINVAPLIEHVMRVKTGMASCAQWAKSSRARKRVTPPAIGNKGPTQSMLSCPSLEFIVVKLAVAQARRPRAW